MLVKALCFVTLSTLYSSLAWLRPSEFILDVIFLKNHISYKV